VNRVRVGLDLTFINRPMGGYERYARALMTELTALPDGPELIAFADPAFGRDLVPDGVELRQPRTLPLFVAKGLLQDQTYWPSLFRRAGVDVVHTPVFAGMSRPPRPYVLTLHDLIPLHAGHTLSRSAAWYWRTVLPRAVSQADVIVTDSEFSRREISRHFGLPLTRIVTVPLGVDPSFRPVADPELRAATRARYRLPADYLLFVGLASPRKNLDRLVAAFGTVAARTTADLVLAGPPGWKNEALEHAVAASAVADRIHRIGTVAEADLPVVYSLARAVANLSSVEGFGLPALEALACGTPLVCAATSAFPEVVDDCGLLVDPLDHSAVVAALDEVLAGGTAVEERRVRGLARARAFTWRRTAEETLTVYRRAAGGR
jgi:glycosyltransferase involved in cell wall biosynthesis